MGASSAPPAPLAVIAPVHPLVSGAAQFNTAMVMALRRARTGPGAVVAAPVPAAAAPSRHPRSRLPPDARARGAEAVLDWAESADAGGAALAPHPAPSAQAIVLPWVHPVMAPPYRYLLRHAPAGIRRVVICHNVEPHEPVPFGAPLTRAVLRHADLLVIHASHQRDELARLGLGDRPVLEAFHPRFAAADLSALPTPDAGRPPSAHARATPALSLLAFGAIRPYKGIDLALEAIARVPRTRRPADGRRRVLGRRRRRCAPGSRELGIEDRVELRDGFVSNEDAAAAVRRRRRVAAARTARRPSPASCSCPSPTASRSSPRASADSSEAIDDGVDGILCPPGDVGALVAAIVRIGRERDAPGRRASRRGGRRPLVPSLRRAAARGARRSAR